MKPHAEYPSVLFHESKGLLADRDTDVPNRKGGYGGGHSEGLSIEPNPLAAVPGDGSRAQICLVSDPTLSPLTIVFRVLLRKPGCVRCGGLGLQAQHSRGSLAEG